MELKAVTLNEREAAKLLGVSGRTLARLRGRKELPYLRIGGRVAYRLATLEEWAKERERQTTECDTRVTA